MITTPMRLKTMDMVYSSLSRLLRAGPMLDKQLFWVKYDSGKSNKELGTLSLNRSDETLNTFRLGSLGKEMEPEKG